MARGAQIQVRIFYGGQEVERLPPEAVHRYGEILSEELSRYCAQNPGAMEQLARVPGAEIIYPEERKTKNAPKKRAGRKNEQIQALDKRG